MSQERLITLTPCNLLRVEELVQCAAPLRELKHVQVLVGGVAAAADQVADMRLGELVLREIGGDHAFGCEPGDEVGQVACACRGFELDTDEDVGFAGAGVAVAEFRDGHGVDDCDEFGKGAGHLGDGDGEEGFFVLSECSALRDESQAVEIHVRTAGGRDEAAVTVGGWIARHPFLKTGECEGASGFDDGACVFEHVFDGGTCLVGCYLNYFVNHLLTYSERLFSDCLHCRTVGEQPDILEQHPLSCLERLHHGVGVVLLHAYDLDVWRYALDVDAHSGDQASASHAAKDGRELRQVSLPQQLHADRSLPSNDIRIVERRYGDQSM
ncbi:hypothetical protein HBI04_241240 [Parastagonospora nodorum]|nr:hypothetical protein HBI04_241240 [Parastagonospora nodorum]KAH5075604.1 hypothetical protein HBH95_129450 [Parastagonospora nodorum]KAH5385845.1 hypothetical protein HBI33_075620 [Parastagonospora nodorum]KAH6237017.1 hypothetical protein HBI53_000170 [Parastagonospora nodorum]